MRKGIFSLLITLVSITAFGQEFNIEEETIFITKVINSGIEQVQDCTKFPRAIRTNESIYTTTGATNWTSGFYPGVLWYAFELSGEEKFKSEAVKWTEKLNDLPDIRTDHDIGFQSMCSFYNGYRITGKEEYKDVIQRSAEKLSKRFDDRIGAIKSWDHMHWYDWQFPVIIDNMMNLELLYWASQNGGSAKYTQVANDHANTTMENHFRDDYSSYHVLIYDTTDGQVHDKITWQGYANWSLWARGQAWAIYGYTLCYRFTKDQKYLDFAQKLADRYLQGLPEDQIPYWDYDAPYIPEEERDASAAAVAASAMLELSTYLDGKYLNNAEQMIGSLSKSYTSKEQDLPAIVLHSVGSKAHGSEIDYHIIYADYYYLEALVRYKKLKAGEKLF